MRTVAVSFLSAVAVLLAANYAASQQPDGPRRGPFGRGGPPPNPLVEALDADNDHVISAKEIENAAEALKKLDRNDDGKITFDEARPFGRPDDGQRGPRSFRGPGRGGPEGRERPDDGEEAGRGRGPRRDGRRDPPSPERFVERAMTFDTDNDGKLNKDELRKFAEGIGRRGPPPGRGPQGRREVSPPERGDRPDRPARPDSE